MSTSLFFSSKMHQRRLCSGLFGGQMDGFAAWLHAQGYSTGIGRDKLRNIHAFECWLTERQIALATLDEALYERFQNEAAVRYKSPQTTGRQFLDWLRSRELIAPEAARKPGPADLIKRRYERHLRDECGASPNTIKAYLCVVHGFLQHTFDTGPIRLECLGVSDVYRYIRQCCANYRLTTTKLHTAALRSFIRYLHRCRDLSVDVGGGIPSVRTYRLGTLPKVLKPHQVAALLASCDRQTVKGRRDHAILLLAARLGLRSCEVVNLTLDDIDWHRGVLTVRGKGGRCDQLPLPGDVAQAIAEYLLDGRREVSAREVFLTVIAPYRRLTISALVSIFSDQLKRSGIKRPGRGSFHLLRHALATEMLRNDASLEEIGQILRHNHLDSTLIYAKVDPAGLQPLAPVWPGGAQ